MPACVQMVTAFLGLDLSYEELVHLLGTRWFGTPFRNLERLEKAGVTVTIAHLGLEGISRSLQAQIPVIAGVHTAALSYWEQAVDHVVVVIGISEEAIYVQDPALPSGPQLVPRTELEMAQLGFDNLCGLLRV